MEHRNRPRANGTVRALWVFLIYMRDFAPGREAWIAGANLSPHFEARLSHAHGYLFSHLNIVFGALLLWLPVRARRARWISVLALAESSCR